MTDISEELAAARREIARLKSELAHRDDGAIVEAASEWRLAADAIQDPIMIHDEKSRIIRANLAYARCAGMPVKALLGKRYWKVFPLHGGPIESCVKALDEGGSEAEEELVLDSGRVFQVRSFSVADDAGDYRYTVHIFRDITARKRNERRLKEQAQRIHQGLVQSVRALGLAIEKRDPYTAGHQGRVAEIAAAIAKGMGFPGQRIEGIRLGSLIHDIGKIHIPAEILNYPGRLGDVERQFIRTHPQVGYDIVKDVEFPWPVAEMILQHHERLDGSGYPHGIKDGEILEEAKILAVADVVEAMASHRPYRPARGPDAALDEISRNRKRLYDPGAVDACIKLFKSPGFMDGLRATPR